MPQVPVIRNLSSTSLRILAYLAAKDMSAGAEVSFRKFMVDFCLWTRREYRIELLHLCLGQLWRQRLIESNRSTELGRLTFQLTDRGMNVAHDLLLRAQAKETDFVNLLPGQTALPKVEPDPSSRRRFSFDIVAPLGGRPSLGVVE